MKLKRQNKIILIYPAMEKGDWHWMPYSLLGIAQGLNDEGYDVYVWDQRVQKEEELFGQLDEDLLYIGVSAMIGLQIRNGVSIARRIRRAMPDIPIVWGGPFVTAGSSEALKDEVVDIAVEGPGELPMLEVARDIRQDRCRVGCKKVYSGRLTNMDTHPRWRFGLIDIKRYINPKTYAMAYVTSYGCTHRCAFCSIGKRYWKTVSAQTVINELDYLIRTYSLKTIVFHDANFFPSERRIRDLCKGIIERDLKIRWHANARADQVLRFSDDTLDLMVASGCQVLFIGVESTAKKLVPLVNKGETPDTIERFIKRIAAYPINIEMHLMFGLPHETPQDSMETIEFYERASRYNPRTVPLRHFYIPLPGTALFHEAVRLGYNPPREFEGWGGLEWKDIKYCVWLSEEDRREMKRLVDEHIVKRVTGRDKFLTVD